MKKMLGKLAGMLLPQSSHMQIRVKHGH